MKPDLREVLERARRYIKPAHPGDVQADADLRAADDALATLQPDGERREAIARCNYIGPCGWKGDLASGLVQDEAGWRDISTAPKDGTEIIAYRPLAHLTNDPPFIVTKTTSCSRTSPQGVEHYTTHWCHPTHWMPLPAPPIRSDRDGGEG